MSDDIFVSKKVGSIGFGLLSPQTIKGMASAKIVTPELYDKEGFPVDGGLMDIRLGVIDPGLRCKTCGAKLKECPGHFGYIEFARPVVHIKFIPIILSLLRSTCKDCGKILIGKDRAQKFTDLIDSLEDDDVSGVRSASQSVLSELRSLVKCPHCGSKQEKVSLEKPSTFNEGDQRLSPIEIRSRLEKISDEDCRLFGLTPECARPEWMILTIMPIPPVTMRPSITLESGERSEDDLTHKLGDIVRINQRLFENINAGAPEIIIEDLWDLLQYHVTTFFDNNVAQLPPARHRGGQPLKTIAARIKSKEGRIRHNLAGKRVNFSSRTVISPDPMLDLNEVGVPEIIAKKLTVPEKVTEWNMERMKKYVEDGSEGYPGANYILRPDGKRKKITDDTKEQLLEELQPGYTVERHLKDGDVVLFNRQPSLHKMSMMAHYVRVLPGRTFRLNPSVCAPYNADFDGDEMNLHVPQTEEARAEAELLMLVDHQLISPRYGLSIIGTVQDGTEGIYVLTKGFDLPRVKAIDLLASIGIEDFSALPKGDIITGKEIFSMLLPSDFNFEGKSKSKEPVIIKKGKLVEGIIDKANLGEGSGLMLRQYHRIYGPKATIKLIGNIFRLGIMTLLRHGFTAAIADTDLPKDASDEIENIKVSAESKVKELISQFEDGTLEPFPGRSVRETLELKILEALNKARNDTGSVVQNRADPKSCSKMMADSGARGNVINLAQIAACVGQQALRGKRIEGGYAKRTLSCFKKDDLSPESKGFIRNGFRQGLKPSEFFFMAMTGRDSLMDTALRTPKSGYLYRRLANALQDLKVTYDDTVRDASNKIVQFKYGDDGLDVSRSENGKINVKAIIDSIK
ncbi:DNA-directed RNA polymerase subunit A' [Candidatus Woesearchaeota archaeon]|nr:DNA-directed RNA polymerase subunit A' [Candidatus Woesearchaeota archaeon]